MEKEKQEEINASRFNILNLIASGKIKEEDVELTEKEKQIIEKYKNTDKIAKENGFNIMWEVPLD